MCVSASASNMHPDLHVHMQAGKKPQREPDAICRKPNVHLSLLYKSEIFTKCLFTCTWSTLASPWEAWLRARAPPGVLGYPSYPLAYMAGTVCVRKHVSTSTEMCLHAFERLHCDTTRPLFIPDWDEGSSVGFELHYGSHKDQETTFPPHFPHEYQRRGSATATATHKEKLQPYYFICITCNRHHIGRCIYCLISTSLAVNSCWFISHRALPKHHT